MAEMIAIAVVGGWALAGLAVMVRLGVFRPASVVGPVPPDPLHPLTLCGVGFLGFFVWAVSVTSAGQVAARLASGSSELRVLLTAAATLISTALLWGMLTATGRMQQPIAPRPASDPPSPAGGFAAVCLAGIVGIVVLIPWVWLVQQFTLLVRSLSGYTDEPRHELLRALLESGSVPMIVLTYLSAAVITPVFEELLFRRVLQEVVKGSLPGYVSPVLRRWGAIGFASIVFALMHDPWSWAAIFTLSLGLGYVYERTGRLSAAILMHALFNATSITFALLGPNGP